MYNRGLFLGREAQLVPWALSLEFRAARAWAGILSLDQGRSHQLTKRGRDQVPAAFRSLQGVGCEQDRSVPQLEGAKHGCASLSQTE